MKLCVPSIRLFQQRRVMRVLLQPIAEAVAVEAGDTPEVLQRRVMEQAEWLLLPAATELVAEKLAK